MSDAERAADPAAERTDGPQPDRILAPRDGPHGGRRADPDGGDAGTDSAAPAAPDADAGRGAASVAGEAAAACAGSGAEPEPGPWSAPPAEAPVAEVAPPDSSPAGPDAPPPEGGGPGAIDVADPDAEALAAIPLPLRIEALLFAATDPLPLRRLRELTACPDGRAVRDAVEAIARECESGGRAWRVEEVAQGWQLRTAAAVAPVVARLGRRTGDDRLSPAALETLAVVAYRQPVLRADVERIRGVACGEVLRALQERGLVRIAGRADLPGAPLLYGTTQRFLEIFGLRDLVDLPRDRELLRPV